MGVGFAHKKFVDTCMVGGEMRKRDIEIKEDRMKDTKGLRFAPIIRVSTEGQAQKGQSLKTQKEQIVRAVEMLGGTIPDHCWRYSGQEHATPDQERHKLDQLLEDAGKDAFDAVIVCDASRWSRDNRRNKEGLEVLRTHGIRFFVGTTEYDLYNPEQVFFLGMATEVNEYAASASAWKSVVNRINRAKEGIPTGGHLPYGRTFDKKTKRWGIDKEKQTRLMWIAERFLAGESLKDLAKKFNMNTSHLYQIFRRHCGDTYTVRIRSKRFNIDETVEMKMPRILPEDLVKKVLQRMDHNKTFYHGAPAARHLLAGYIKCETCGYGLYGQVVRKRWRYYRHRKDKGCNQFKYIPALQIEAAVLLHLFATFGDEKKIKKAAEAAIPNLEKLRRMEDQLKTFQGELKRVLVRRHKLIENHLDGFISKDEFREFIQANRDREALLKEEIAALRDALANVPDREELSRKIKLANRMTQGFFRSPEHLKDMKWEDARALVEAVFDGRDERGRPFGVYLRKDGDTWHYTIKGRLIDETSRLPMTTGEAQAIFGVHGDAPEDWNPMDYIFKSDMLSGDCTLSQFR